MKILLSAFACNPKFGSESSYGFNWANSIAQRGYHIHCITRAINEEDIESSSYHPNIKFVYIKLPFGLEKLYYYKTVGLYIYYLIWQWLAYRRAKQLNKKENFKIVHHITFGSLQMGSFMYRLKIPFVFGPTGGGQMPPKTLKEYFEDGWGLEQKRERISNLMLQYNPACYNTIKRSDAILASNYDTRAMAEKLSPRKIFDVLDTCLNDEFIPSICPEREINGKVKLLWLGRVFPRKGILLAIEVMQYLKQNKNIELTIVGDGPFMSKMLNKIKEYQLEETVKVLGRVDYEKVTEIYLTHHFLLFTSLRDAVGVQMVEAMAFGLPVIGLNIHGQSQVIQPNRGIKVDVNTSTNIAEAMAKAVIEITSKKDEYKQLSEAAHVFALENSFSKKAEFVTSKVYNQLLNKS